MGELSVELPLAEVKGPGAVLPSGGKHKRDVLAESAVTTSTLARYRTGVEMRRRHAAKITFDELNKRATWVTSTCRAGASRRCRRKVSALSQGAPHPAA